MMILLAFQEWLYIIAARDPAWRRRVSLLSVDSGLSKQPGLMTLRWYVWAMGGRSINTVHTAVNVGLCPFSMD